MLKPVKKACMRGGYPTPQRGGEGPNIRSRRKIAGGKKRDEGFRDRGNLVASGVGGSEKRKSAV